MLKGAKDFDVWVEMLTSFDPSHSQFNLKHSCCFGRQGFSFPSFALSILVIFTAFTAVS